MNIKKTNTKGAKIILVGIILVISLTGAVAYAAYTNKSWPFQATSSRSSEDVANSSDATNPQQKKDLPTVTDADKSGANKTTDEVPVAQAGSLTIDVLEQRDGNIIYSASSENASSPATCSALFEQIDGAARPVTRVTPATDKGCSEVSIPESEFVALGEWKLTLRYYTAGTQLVATKTIEVK